ncbi:MAG: class I SAM-dependent methyltransferase, partial [Chloroflexota bacterium]
METLVRPSAPRDFAVRLWDGGELVPEVAGPPRFTLVFHHPAALGRMVLDRSDAALGEAYICGAFDLEGDIIAAFDLADVVRNVGLAGWERLGLAAVALMLRAARGTPTASARFMRTPARLVGPLHSRARDQAAISYHYDVSNAFYALWLDRRMVYSCAYFPTGKETLDEAQERKLEHICR